MTYAIISDVHANEVALESVLADARSNGAERVICLGDVVGYGPEPEKAVSLVRRAATATMAGNHDDAVSGRLDPSDFIDLAADAVARHREALSSSSLVWLKCLPYTFAEGRFACAHGDFTAPKVFNYVTDEDEAAANFAARTEQLLFVGHSHVPGIFLTGASGRVYRLDPTDFVLEDGKRYIVNPGSVGYPRAEGGVCESTYVLYDDKTGTVLFRRLPFTISSVMQTGRNPRRLRKRVLAAAALVSAIAAGAAVWAFAPRSRVRTETRVEKVAEVITNTVEEAFAQADRSAECAIPPGVGKIRILAKSRAKHSETQFWLVFYDSSGRAMPDGRQIYKLSSGSTNREFDVPPGAARAVFSARSVSGGKKAAFSKFEIKPSR
ncbi:MAG: metallophosphoesterase family protein [Kiritimatiellae bacterium]|nr:metallophosphoesterase family protein [Kiritimatiellia bacterium]